VRTATSIDRQRDTVAIVIGYSKYAHFPPVPAIARNVGALVALLNSWLFGFELDDIFVFSDDSHQPVPEASVGDAFTRLVRTATNTLLVYYAGHAFVNEDKLYLALPRTEPDDPDRLNFTALPFAVIAKPVSKSNAAIKFIIVDCCEAATDISLIFQNMKLEISGPDELAGTFAVGSSAPGLASLAPPGELYTSFTGHLIGVVTRGLPGKGSELTFNDVFFEVKRRLTADRDSGQRTLPDPVVLVAPGDERGVPLVVNGHHRQASRRRLVSLDETTAAHWLDRFELDSREMGLDELSLLRGQLSVLLRSDLPLARRLAADELRDALEEFEEILVVYTERKARGRRSSGAVSLRSLRDDKVSEVESKRRVIDALRSIVESFR
jgi:hypothetical protein